MWHQHFLFLLFVFFVFVFFVVLCLLLLFCFCFFCLLFYVCCCFFVRFLVFCFVCCFMFVVVVVFLFYKGWVQSASSPHLPLPVKPTVIILACSPIAIFFRVFLRAYLKHFLCYPGLLENRCWDARFFYVVSESCAASRPNANRMHVFVRCSHRKIIVLALLYKNAAVFHSV